MLDRERVERGEIGERRQLVDVDREVVDPEPERRDPRRVLALGEQRLVLGAYVTRHGRPATGRSARSPNPGGSCATSALIVACAVADSSASTSSLMNTFGRSASACCQ